MLIITLFDWLSKKPRKINFSVRFGSISDVEAIALLRSIILTRIYILKISVQLFQMTLHRKNTRVIKQFSYETSDDLSREYCIKFCIKKFAS